MSKINFVPTGATVFAHFTDDYSDKGTWFDNLDECMQDAKEEAEDYEQKITVYQFNWDFERDNIGEQIKVKIFYPNKEVPHVQS
jgi:hypothetical protein